jgi:hypothetical protein
MIQAITYKELCIIKEKEIERLNKLVLQLQETVADLQQYLVPPKFKQGDIVNVMGMPDTLYIIDDFVCYDTSYAMYNVHDISNIDNFETVSEIDLIETNWVKIGTV